VSNVEQASSVTVQQRCRPLYGEQCGCKKSTSCNGTYGGHKHTVEKRPTVMQISEILFVFETYQNIRTMIVIVYELTKRT
jgi:hypothetical protein